MNYWNNLNLLEYVLGKLELLKKMTNEVLHTFPFRQILNSLEKVEFIGKILNLFEEKPE